ncbi:hypothetical protein MSG28_008731 [Choristoneura fumiferana]|uniref:Uncharacterized protein n=1 Tax=Choristoneura fumiferana TaxID=7141 RepID=A0ACC0J7T0_CHOFU|nr:hypothetical protein MSG28_008731 [Choristoneura fumiferana]
MGLTQGFLYPSLHGLLGQWSPVAERSRMGTIVYAGAQLGTIIEMMTAGVLSASKWGWPSVYYVTGITCLAWSILWIIFGASTPGTSRWISKEERKYIETNAGSAAISEAKKMKTPWRSIWTSLPFWAILLAHSGQSLGFWTLLTEMPSYMDKVLGVDIKNIGLSSLIFCSLFPAFWGPALALLILSYLPPGHLTLAVVILTFTVGLNGAHYVGFLITHIDISPNFASTLMGITNGFGNIFSIMAPLSVSLVVKDETSASEWRKVFFISIAFYFLSNLFYVLFMSGNIQDWNEPQMIKTLDVKKENKTSKNYGEEKF